MKRLGRRRATDRLDDDHSGKDVEASKKSQCRSFPPAPLMLRSDILSRNPINVANSAAESISRPGQYLHGAVYSPSPDANSSSASN